MALLVHDKFDGTGDLSGRAPDTVQNGSDTWTQNNVINVTGGYAEAGSTQRRAVISQVQSNIRMVCQFTNIDSGNDYFRIYLRKAGGTSTSSSNDFYRINARPEAANQTMELRQGGTGSAVLLAEVDNQLAGTTSTVHTFAVEIETVGSQVNISVGMKDDLGNERTMYYEDTSADRVLGTDDIMFQWYRSSQYPRLLEMWIFDDPAPTNGVVNYSTSGSTAHSEDANDVGSQAMSIDTASGSFIPAPIIAVVHDQFTGAGVMEDRVPDTVQNGSDMWRDSGTGVTVTSGYAVADASANYAAIEEPSGDLRIVLTATNISSGNDYFRVYFRNSAGSTSSSDTWYRVAWRPNAGSDTIELRRANGDGTNTDLVSVADSMGGGSGVNTLAIEVKTVGNQVNISVGAKDDQAPVEERTLYYEDTSASRVTTTGEILVQWFQSTNMPHLTEFWVFEDPAPTDGVLNYNTQAGTSYSESATDVGSMAMSIAAPTKVVDFSRSANTVASMAMSLDTPDATGDLKVLNVSGMAVTIDTVSATTDFFRTVTAPSGMAMTVGTPVGFGFLPVTASDVSGMAMSIGSPTQAIQATQVEDNFTTPTLVVDGREADTITNGSTWEVRSGTYEIADGRLKYTSTTSGGFVQFDQVQANQRIILEDVQFDSFTGSEYLRIYFRNNSIGTQSGVGVEFYQLEWSPDRSSNTLSLRRNVDGVQSASLASISNQMDASVPNSILIDVLTDGNTVKIQATISDGSETDFLYYEDVDADRITTTGNVSLRWFRPVTPTTNAVEVGRFILKNNPNPSSFTGVTTSASAFAVDPMAMSIGSTSASVLPRTYIPQDVTQMSMPTLRASGFKTVDRTIPVDTDMSMSVDDATGTAGIGGLSQDVTQMAMSIDTGLTPVLNLVGRTNTDLSMAMSIATTSTEADFGVIAQPNTMSVTVETILGVQFNLGVTENVDLAMDIATVTGSGNKEFAISPVSVMAMSITSGATQTRTRVATPLDVGENKMFLQLADFSGVAVTPMDNPLFRDQLRDFMRDFLKDLFSKP